MGWHTLAHIHTERVYTVGLSPCRAARLSLTRDQACYLVQENRIRVFSG